jgi:serine/threonine-protein kinase
MLHREIALKVLIPDRMNSEHVERFLREARSCSRIEHPNVVTIHDVGEENETYYIVMQYVKGKNLAEIVQTQGGPLPWRTALKILRYDASGLAAVHKQGLLHRDIKPSNIMVGDDSRVQLMDFGLVRDEAQSDLTGTGVIMGTPIFMAPEQCTGSKLDRRTDIDHIGQNDNLRQNLRRFTSFRLLKLPNL